ncbi:hypothetical protein IscW_ISCW011835 [Ixodes scapularis]|uniref:Uncharacterized protein n=1 Tax=Ixodes scapularis TaxID=6945 RepID=B7Q854_IXOSC|nr:hypothetical protein IscW_ISCW011835 [Ixodes scapularis]|eukprot:XP_002412290.1 hypothetical protein IscW_ISCW011835 [Ixodes scapularis]
MEGNEHLRITCILNEFSLRLPPNRIQKTATHTLHIHRCQPSALFPRMTQQLGPACPFPSRKLRKKYKITVHLESMNRETHPTQEI